MIVWPKVRAALPAFVASVHGWGSVEVFNGPPVTQGAPADWCSVGFVKDEGSAGDFNQEQGDLDGCREETGEIRCELVLKGDEGSMTELHLRASAYLDALDAALRADQSLGGLLGQGDSVVLGADFLPVQNTSGASVRVAMSIQYFSRSE